VGLSSWRTLEVALPRSRSRRTLEAVDVAVIVLPDIYQFLPISAWWHSVKSAVAHGWLEASMERVETQVDGMPHDDCLMTRGLIILTLSWASSHHLPQRSSYHQNSVKHLSDMYEYINTGKLMKSKHGPSQGLTTIVLPWSGEAVRKNHTGIVLCKIWPWV
jgi:hypothetical protein